MLRHSSVSFLLFGTLVAAACSSPQDAERATSTSADAAADGRSHDFASNDAAVGAHDAAEPPIDGGAPTWTNVYAFLESSCSGASKCHRGPDPGGVLEISDSAATYATLVGAAATSTGCAGAKRVVPGNAKASVLFQAIDSTSPCSGSMPPKLGGLLPTWQRALVRDWIDAGALQN